MLSQVVPPFQERVFFCAQLKDSINKDNKGRFGFLKIDATHAVFCWVRWTTRQMRKFVSFANRFVVLWSLRSGPWYLWSKKMEPTTFSAVSSKPAGQRQVFPLQISSLQAPSADRYLVRLRSLKWWPVMEEKDGPGPGSSQDTFRTNCSCELSIPCLRSLQYRPTGKLSSLSRIQSWSTKKNCGHPFSPVCHQYKIPTQTLMKLGPCLLKTIRTLSMGVIERMEHWNLSL